MPCLLQVTLIFIIFFGSAECDTWSYGNVSLIMGSSLDPSAVLEKTMSRSIVECSTKCLDISGCSGVAFRDGECSFINVALAEPSFCGWRSGEGQLPSNDYLLQAK